MRITVFTSNQPRHTALIESLAAIADEVLAVQECNTVFPGAVEDFFRKSAVMQAYFSRVIAAENAVFGPPRFPAASNVRQFPIRMGDLNRVSPESLGDVMTADCFIVFGASFIKGWLCDALVERCAVNIHMGISPQYRGSSTNFWALYDRRPEFVGATIHRLTKGLDSGPILFHALPAAAALDPFELGMQAVAAAHAALLSWIQTGDRHSPQPLPQDRRLELRYTRNADFSDAVAEEYLQRLMSPQEIGDRLRQRSPVEFIRPIIPTVALTRSRQVHASP